MAARCSRSRRRAAAAAQPPHGGRRGHRPRGRAGRRPRRRHQQHGPPHRHGLDPLELHPPGLREPGGRGHAGQAGAGPGAGVEAGQRSHLGVHAAARRDASTTASRSTPTPCCSTSTASSGRTSTSGASRTSPPGTSFEKVYPSVTRWEKVDDHTVRIHTSEPAANLWDFIGREPLVPRAYTIKNGVGGAERAPGRHRAVEAGGVEAQGPHALRAQRALLGRAAARSSACASRPFPRRRRASPRCARARSVSSRRCRRSTPACSAASPRCSVVSSVRRSSCCRLYVNGRPKDKYESGGKDGLFADPKVRLALNHAVNRDGDHQEDLPRLRPRQRLAGRHRLVRVRRAGAVRLRSGAGEGAPGRGGLADTRRRRADKGGSRWLSAPFPAKHYGQAFDEMTPAVVEMLKDVGVQVTVKPLDFGTLLQMLHARARCRPTAASPPVAPATTSTPTTTCATGRRSRW